MRLAALLVPLLMISLPESSTAAEPEVSITFHVGDTVESALTALNAKGYRIVYSSALVLPTMTLRTVPKATNIRELLQEILAPWQLNIVHTQSGEWLVVNNGSSAKIAPTVSIEAQSPSETTLSLDTIVITGSRFGLAMDGTDNSFLDRKDVEHMPHLADDAMRILKVLPGVSGGDYSAALNIRGGRRDETMVLIDGAEIHNATHFRDIDGTFSVLDTNLVESINFTTGGMTVDYSDYMSGVVDMRTHRPGSDDEYRNAAGISFTTAYGRSGGTFSDGKGSWLVSTRRGFLDLLADMTQGNGDKFVPRYTDVFATMNFDFTSHTSVAAHLLFSDDNLKYINEDKTESVDSAGRGHSLHAWVTLDRGWSENLDMHTILAAATLNVSRSAEGSDDKRSGRVFENNKFQFLDFRQDWSWKNSQTFSPRWGFNFNQQRANYDYAIQEQITARFVSPLPIDVAYGTQLNASSSKYGAYVSLRTRVFDSLTTEAGVRWDNYQYPLHYKFSAISPRINLVYAFDERNTLRAAWSVMSQPQGISELQIEDNVTQIFRPERSRQVTVGYSRALDYGLSLRLDVYDKMYSDLRPRFENSLDPIQLIPEGALDRVRINAPEARAQGIELTLRRDVKQGLAGWMSVALAKAEDKEQGKWVPRTWEQETTFSFGGSWTGAKWNVSLAGTFHTGTPTTRLSADGVGPRNDERLGAYSRLDLRANRDVWLHAGKFSYYLEVTNLLNSKNECCVEDYGFKQDQQGNSYFFQRRSYGFPILPSAGIHFEF
jgi:outer membrane cobalamin receptor